MTLCHFPCGKGASQLVLFLKVTLCHFPCGKGASYQSAFPLWQKCQLSKWLCVTSLVAKVPVNFIAWSDFVCHFPCGKSASYQSDFVSLHLWQKVPVNFIAWSDFVCNFIAWSDTVCEILLLLGSKLWHIHINQMRCLYLFVVYKYILPNKLCVVLRIYFAK